MKNNKEKNKHIDYKESFQPISVKSPKKNKFLFFLRTLLDIQTNTINKFLRENLPLVSENILDVGAGECPWRCYLRKNVVYKGVDIDNNSDFKMNYNENVLYYDGNKLPFEDSVFHNCMCVEVLEHVQKTKDFLDEIFRVLKKGGKLFLTVPFSARRHHLPFDFYRFTEEGLRHVLNESNFTNIIITPRGNEICVIFNKLLIVNIKLLGSVQKIGN